MSARAAIYARVSTIGNGQSPEMQLRELREYCERRGWQIAGEYVDSGISGAKDRRLQLDRMMDDAHKRRFEVVAVWKFDRFARSVSHLLRALDTFRVLGIEFVSLSESRIILLLQSVNFSNHWTSSASPYPGQPNCCPSKKPLRGVSAVTHPPGH